VPLDDRKAPTRGARSNRRDRGRPERTAGGSRGGSGTRPRRSSDDFQHSGRDRDEDEDLHAQLARLERQRDAEEEPRGETEDRLPEHVALPVKGESDAMNAVNATKQREGPAGRQHYSTVMLFDLVADLDAVDDVMRS